jgi:hypothetical protein
MKKNNLYKRIGWSVGIGILAVYLVMPFSTSKAEVAVGNAHATVVSPLSVHITPAPSLSGIIVSVEEANRRATAGTPVLRIGFPPPPGATSPAITAAASTAEAASNTAVSVTVNPDGSLSVSGQGSGVYFTVARPAKNVVTIEYN